MAHTDRIAEFLKTNGPQSSSTVAESLVSLGLSDVAARKAIERAGEPVRKLAGIRLPNRQRVLFHRDQYGTEAFWDQLAKVLKDSGSIYGTAISGLEACGGSVPKEHFHRSSGAPTKLRGQVASDRVLSVLCDVGMLETKVFDELGPVIQFHHGTGFGVQPYSLLRARLVAEAILLRALADWLRKNGLVSFSKVAVRANDFVPEFGSYRWDLTAPSYLRPLTSSSKSGLQPGFVVADVLLNEVVTETHVQYLLRKAENLASRRKLRPTLVFLLAIRFQIGALKSGRSGGFVFTTPSLMFGDEIASALVELIDVLSKAAANAAVRPEIVADLFDKLSRIEGAAGNLRGPLFELIVGYSVLEVEGNSIDIGVEATTTEGSADIDVLRVKGSQEVWAYECKGYSAAKLVSAGEVEKWLSTSIPRIYAWIKSEWRFRNLNKVGFEFWTTGNFAPEAIELLNKHSAQTRRYEIRWRQGSQVEEYVKQAHNKRLLDVLREHFSRHPLAEYQ